MTHEAADSGTATPPADPEDGERMSIPATTAAEAVQVVQEKAAAAMAASTEVVQVAQEKAAAATLPDRAALARGRGGLAVAVAGLAGYGLLYALVKANRSTAVDVAISLKIQNVQRPWFARLMTAVSWPGFAPQNWAIPTALVVSTWGLGFRTEAAFQALAWGSGPLSAALKATMKRSRPAHPGLRVVTAPLRDSSFPSGHVLQYVSGFGFLAYCVHTLVRKKRVRQPVVAALCGLIACVGPSRIYQGHHWPTDVSASYLLGTSYLVGVTTLYRQVKARGIKQ